MSFVAPYPSSPSAPKPQQRTLPLSSSAQVNATPAVIATAFRPAPRSTGPTEAGVSSSPIVVVFP